MMWIKIFSWGIWGPASAVAIQFSEKSGAAALWVMTLEDMEVCRFKWNSFEKIKPISVNNNNYEMG